jgi:protein involved in polysaccharide export with SLBB domain
MIDQSRPFPFRLLCLVMAGLTACSTTQTTHLHRQPYSSALNESSKEPEYVDHWEGRSSKEDPVDPMIVPGYQLTLHCIADPKMNGDYRVEFNGNLQLPYDVSINTTGLTMSELKKKLSDSYRPYFRVSPEIEVRIKQKDSWLDVRGLVEKPGRYLVEPGASLDAVIGEAGGLSKTQPPAYVRIQKGNKIFVLDLSEYYRQGGEHPQIQGWEGGEVIFFQTEPVSTIGNANAVSPYRSPVYVLGEVKKPGGVSLTPGADFVDTLVQAGGFTDRADLDSIELIRRTGKKKRIYEFSWEDVPNTPKPIEGDVFMIHADNVTKVERHTTLLAALIGALATAVTATILVLSYNKGRI